MKQCTKCKKVKSNDEFNKHPETLSGLQSQCKQCQKEYRQGYRARNRKREYNKSPKGKASKRKYYLSEKGHVSHKKYLNSEKGKSVKKRYIQGYRIRYPEKRKAQSAISRATQKGRIPRANTLKCHICNKPSHLYHHYKGYEKEHWLDVLPTCRNCHNAIHNFGISFTERHQ